MGGGWCTPRPGRFTSGKEAQYLLYRRLDGSQGRSGRVRKIPPPTGFNGRTVLPVASHYTAYISTNNRVTGLDTANEKIRSCTEYLGQLRLANNLGRMNEGSMKYVTKRSLVWKCHGKQFNEN